MWEKYTTRTLRTLVYLNNRMFQSRSYQLIVAPWKFGDLKEQISAKSEASRANTLVLRSSNFHGATIRPIIIVPRQKHLIFRAPVHKSYWIIFIFFWREAWKPNVKFGKKTKKTNSKCRSINLSYLLKARLTTEKISRTSTIHQGIFLGHSLEKHYGQIISLHWWTLARSWLDQFI